MIHQYFYGANNRNAIQLFIYVPTQQPKGQLQSEQEWKKHTEYKTAIYNIWVVMIAILTKNQCDNSKRIEK
jgi:accessory gene regulator protein AgrB